MAATTYKSGAIAVDFHSGNAPQLYDRARGMVEADGLYLLHALRLTGARHDLDFDASAMEQEYWNCDTYLAEWGEKFQIPKSRQVLLVGPVAERINEFVSDKAIEVLVIGGEENTIYPVDVVSGVMQDPRCDLLVVAEP